jgi:tRNA threonylcarbamoyladenosine biosynthesis protein TsaB
MKLLALETSTEACSVALWVDGELQMRHALAPRQHAELALPWAEALLVDAGLAKSQLDAIAVGRGPGAFTGVRLGISLAQGIALALDRPVVPVSTLAALAMRAATLMPSDGSSSVPMSPANASVHVLAAIDARMSELYVGYFEMRDGDAIPMSQESLAVPDTVVLPAGVGAFYGVGTGFSALDSALRKRLSAHLRAVDAEALPQADDVARLAALAYARGEAVAPERLEPAYLRNHVALTLAEQAVAKRG